MLDAESEIEKRAYRSNLLLNFYSPGCGQNLAKGPFGLLVKLPPSHLSIILGGGFTPFLFIAESQKSSEC